MAVTETVTLPAQPTIGSTIWVPLGGDGVTAPIGYYDVLARIVGDASGGVATVHIIFDNRYTNLLAWSNIGILADTAAGDFALQMEKSNTALTSIQVVGTIPGVAESFIGQNSSYLWFPPPTFYAGDGQVRFFTPNVDATESYQMAIQVFAYNRDVRNRMNMTWLHQIVPSTNAPVAS